jgi:hypothetical protein
VTIKAAEKLMDRALWVSEVVRRKVEGLHMIIKVSEKKIVDEWEPREEGLVTVRQERFLTILEVTLTKTPTAEEKKHPGYHEPLTIKTEFLTKETWEKDEKEREERRNRNGGDREERGDRRGGERRAYDKSGDRPPRRDREERAERGGERGAERGGERRRGRDNRE